MKLSDFKTNTSERDRILALPTDDREPGDVDLTDEFATPDGEWQLRPIQSLGLQVAREAGGLVASIAVGGGKTLLSLLLPTAMDAKRPLLLIPASRRDGLINEAVKYDRHFDYDDNIEVWSYTELSRKDGHERLFDLQPDLIIADEAHKLRDRSTGRTKRVLRYFKAHPDTAFCAMSGTLTSTGIDDYYHLVELALQDANPIPRSYSRRGSWAAVIDVNERVWPSAREWRELQPLVDQYGDGTDLLAGDFQTRKKAAREAFFTRFEATPGVVMTQTSSCAASILIEADETPEVPEAIREAIEHLNETWELPDGSYVENPMHKAKHLRHLLQGFYYRWDWTAEPWNGEPDVEWLRARKDWNREVNAYCRQSIPGRDTPGLVKDALQSPDVEVDAPDLQAAWAVWQGQRHKQRPPTETVWIDDYLIAHAVEYAKANDAIIWYEPRAVASRLIRHGVDVYLPDDGRNPEDVEQARPVGLSIRSHATGANLQYAFSDQYVLAPPTSGQTWEQLLGRTHRAGQPADEVRCAVGHHHPAFREAMAKARRRARYIEQSNGQPQKLLFADHHELC